MSVDTSENDLLAETKENLHPLHVLQKDIANMPAVDTAKVQAVLQKLNNGALDILGTEAEQQASAERIAHKIMAELVENDPNTA